MSARSWQRLRRRGVLSLAVAPALAAWGRRAGAAEPDRGPARDSDEQPVPERALHVGAGAFVHIYDPSVGENEQWYINDHCFERGADGVWHLFGITHPEPADPADEHLFAHATAPDLHGPWTKQPPALTVDPTYHDETHLWAPHVVHHDDRYWMFYSGGGTDHTRYAISAATSTDLWNWTRLPGGPVFRDGYDARDPMVVRLGAEWVLFYAATSSPRGGNHVVAFRTSSDLVHWSERGIAYTDPSRGTTGGPTESPFVVRHRGVWYLFIGPRGGYVGTDVFASLTPLHVDTGARVGHVDAHAAEVVVDNTGWWISAAGWGQGGVYLAPLEWR